MKQYLIGLFVITFIMGCTHTTTLPKNKKPAWQTLFNGKDLTGWIPKIKGYDTGNNFGNTFRVVDGLLCVSYDGYDEFNYRYGHLFFERPFSSYRMKVEYRFVGDQVKGGEGWATKNSGVMIHGQSPQSMLKDQDFPISIEVQLLGGLKEGNLRPTANICTPGTEAYIDGVMIEPHCLQSSSRTYYGEEWVTAEIDVTPQAIVHFVNGIEVLRYTRPEIGGGVVAGYDPQVKKDGSALTGGYISLQSESHPIQFRKVEILEY